MKELSSRSSPEEKIALFRSLFRGREDVFPRRFENTKTKKSGYSPVCENAWVRHVCEKPKIKCAECRYRRFVPISDAVVKMHLSGKDEEGKDFVMGVYPMLLDETCFFLAVDFDKTSWQQDAKAFLKVCQTLEVPAVLERSRSGNGAHIWIFFEEALPASLARNLGAHILTEVMEQYPEVGLGSYDRFFPNQDTLPQGGFGNLIALPLQKRAREKGNSVFLDEEMVVYEDQWAFLASIRKMTKYEVEKIVQQARGDILGAHLKYDEESSLPWHRSSIKKTCIPPEGMPKVLEITVSNELYIAKKELHPFLRNQLIRLAAFQNPQFYQAQAMRLSTYNIPRLISCSSDHPDHIGIPRGCLDDVYRLCAELKIKVSLLKSLQEGKQLHFKFTGELRSDQRKAAESLLKTDLGVLSATTAFGKTVVGAYLIAERKVNTLILVHRKQLQEQWISRLSTFLDVPKSAIGRIGGGRSTITGEIDVALIQSLVRKGVVRDVVSQYGHIIVDECHHIPAFSFEEVVRSSNAKFITGLTATVARKDGHHPIILMRCGPVRHKVDAKVAAALSSFEHTVFVRPTSFFYKKDPNDDLRVQFQNVCAALIQDEARNQMICDEVIQAARKGRFPLVLTERKEHLNCLFEKLSPHIRRLIVLRGGMKPKEMGLATELIERASGDEERVILATGKFIGEGFDDPRLDTLFLTMPVSWKGTVAQYVGRLHRLYEHKQEVQVYDYADLNVSSLEKMFNRRCLGYEAVGYRILVPASAIAGWPVDVPLPVDPAWKADYAGSVKRLIRDGVDMPLAHLFVQAAQTEGEDRARSSTERFLFRRLETLPETTGRFLLNEKLNIPFDGYGKMEVDFLCKNARLVVELDGEQHLNDPDAYRWDRKKDALLQEHGYMVLRFLTEDVAKHLDTVLDSILRTLTHLGSA